MKRFLNWYGVLIILLAMWIGSSALFWTHLRDQTKQDAEEHGQQFKEEAFRSEYWAGYFENHQSEYAQLFFQGLLIGAFGVVLFKKEKEELLRLEHKVDDLLRRAGATGSELEGLGRVE